MKRAIKTYWPAFSAMIVIMLISAGVGGYILSNQRFYLPKWVPVLGSDFVDYKAELQTAQSITPGQGQTVNVAGVPIGEISKVDLVNGRAVVTMKIRRKYTPIYKNASILVRPKTGLNDMILELTPGNRQAGVLPIKGTIPVSQTLPNVNLDEILASLDADTRDYLQLLVGGAGEGLKNNGTNLAAALKRFAPTTRDTNEVTRLLAERQANIKRTIHNFGQLSAALASKDEQLAEFVDSSNRVFQAFANQDANLRSTLRELPPTLQVTNTGLQKADKLASVLGPTLGKLRPGARALGPSLKQTRPFLKTTTPVIRDQLRPFARDALPTVKLLRPAARDLASITPALTESLKVVNYALNELAYDKPGDSDQSYLYWFNWVNHLGATLFATQDAHGPIRRGLLVLSCGSLGVLDNITKVNPQLGLLVSLLGAPTTSQVCGTASGASRAAGGVSPSSPDAPTPVTSTVSNTPPASAKAAR